MFIRRSVNSDWLFNTLSKVLQANWFILEINGRANMSCHIKFDINHIEQIKWNKTMIFYNESDCTIGDQHDQHYKNSNIFCVLGTQGRYSQNKSTRLVTGISSKPLQRLFAFSGQWPLQHLIMNQHPFNTLHEKSICSLFPVNIPLQLFFLLTLSQLPLQLFFLDFVFHLPLQRWRWRAAKIPPRRWKSD